MASHPAAQAESRTLTWRHGRADLQRLGAMLAPVVFESPGHPPFAPLQVAPWCDEPGAAELPGILRRLRGDWPCVPFGRTDRPAGLFDGGPPGWTAREPHDAWGHGHSSHHDWQWADAAASDPLSLVLEMTLPAGDPIAHLRRQVTARADAPALDLTLTITPRIDCTLPVALHPTLRLDAGRVQLDIAHAGSALSYPVPPEPSSRLQANARFEALHAAPLAAGGTTDLSRYPQGADSEELLQLVQVAGPVHARYLDAGWALTLDWDHAALPDLMLWVSHRGRPQPPWNGRHWALGIEPVNGVFDLGRVAAPPADHPLAGRAGLSLRAGVPTTLRHSLSAQPLAQPPVTRSSPPEAP